MYPKAIGDAFQVNGVWYQDYMVQDETTGEVVTRRYKYENNQWVVAKIDMTKKIANNSAGISLKKNIVNLDKAIVNLSKKSGINLACSIAKVAVVLDYSGSMSQEYSSGRVQEALNRLVPLGLRFDDNGELDVWLFHNSYKKLEGLTVENYENYVNSVVKRSGFRYGGTEYAPVLGALHKQVMADSSGMPTFVIYITDGDNSDKRDTDRIVRISASSNMFIQFVGIGYSSFEYLEKLDDLSGRQFDNTGFIKVASFSSLSDDELYNKLLEQYVEWMKAVGIK